MADTQFTQINYLHSNEQYPFRLYKQQTTHNFYKINVKRIFQI